MAKTTCLDTCLFVRLALGHLARAAGLFTILSSLKNSPDTHAQLLKEVLAVNLGYALYIDLIDLLQALELYTKTIIKTITNCKVEQQLLWTIYRIDDILRLIKILDNSTILNRQITDVKLGKAIYNATGQSLVKVIETRASAKKGLYNTSQIINFLTHSYQLLPKSLQILKITVSLYKIIYKPKVIQCTNCFQ